MYHHKYSDTNTLRSVSDSPQATECDSSAKEQRKQVCNWENQQCSELPGSPSHEPTVTRRHQKERASRLLEPGYLAFLVLAISVGYGSCLGRLAGLT